MQERFERERRVAGGVASRARRLFLAVFPVARAVSLAVLLEIQNAKRAFVI